MTLSALWPLKSQTLKKLLIIEDDVDTLELMGYILHEAGYAAIQANRQVSIKVIAAIKPNLAILDYLLPFGSGIEMCLEIKSDPLTAHIPVILYSASNQLKQFAKSSKADAYIAKPFDVDELIKLVGKTAL